MRGIGDGLMPSPAAGRARRPAAHRSATVTRSRSAATSTRRPISGRVDRVVVAVQAHVVVPRQPQRGPPPGRRRDRRQLTASRPGRRRSGRPGRSPAPDVAGWLTSMSQSPSWALKSAGLSEGAAGQERGLQVAVGPLDQALGLRISRTGRSPPWWPACRGTPGVAAVSSLWPRRHRPIAASPSQTRTRGTAPSAWSSAHQPRQQILHCAGGDQHGPTATGQYPVTITSTGSRVGPAGLAEPDRQLDRRGTTGRTGRPPQPHTPSARPGPAADRPDAARPTRSRSTRIDRSQPIRSAITVAGIVGHACSSSRIRGSTASTIEPRGGRW